MEDLLISSRDVMNNISSTGLESQNLTTNMGNGKSDNIQEISTASGAEKSSPVSSPNLSPHPSPKVRCKRDHSKGSSDSTTKESNNLNKLEEQQFRVSFYALLLKLISNKFSVTFSSVCTAVTGIAELPVAH